MEALKERICEPTADKLKTQQKINIREILHCMECVFDKNP